MMWHLAKADDRGRPTENFGKHRLIKVGQTLKIKGKPRLCKHGLHASKRIIDALSYAQGSSIITKVKLSGEIVHGDDKSVATKRTCLAILSLQDSKQILRKFARLCALDVVDEWDAPEIVIKWLKTGDEKYRSAAYSAACSAAYSVAESAFYAARSAAESAFYAARSAAESAYSAARSAAYSANSAARSAAESAYSAARSAAESAYSAAESAARKKQNKRLTRMVNNALKQAREK